MMRKQLPAELFKASLGKLPEDCRTVNMTSLFKKCRRCESQNYGPVSLTSARFRVVQITQVSDQG